MFKSWKVLSALVLLTLIIGLTGCELRRSDGENSDLAPVSELPPTLAPLGADGEELTGEATPIPTVINVQATATESTLGAGQAAESPTEPVAPTNQPASLGESTSGTEAGQATASVAPETFTAPAIESESIVVDANTSDLPAGGPVAANPPASQTAPVASSANSYTVRPGDTLFGIAQAYGLTVEEIMLANGLPSDIIYTDQTLTIPAGGGVDGMAQPTYAQQPTYEQPAYETQPQFVGVGGGHVVAPGETLYRIALTYGTSVDAIAGANGIPYPYVIQVGQQLAIPGPGEYAAPPPPAGGYYQQPDPGYYQQPDPGYYQQPEQQGGYYQPEPTDNNYPAPDYSNPAPAGIAGTHTVVPGETLFMIAQRYGVTADMIASANGLADPNQLYVGQVLYLP